MKILILISTVTLLTTSVLAQEKPKTELVFQNPDSKKQVTIMVEDDVNLRLRRPDVIVSGKVLTLTDTTIEVSQRQNPFRQLVLLENVYSISINRQGYLSNFKKINTTADTTIFRIETIDGNEFTGTIMSQDQEKLLLKTALLGEITIQKKNVRDIAIVDPKQMKGGVLWRDNPQSSRYFWAPNGYGIKKGQGYYQNVWIMVNQWTYAPSNNFSLGVGLIPLFLFGGASTPIWMTAKFSVPLKADKINLGAGILSGTVVGEEQTGFGIGFGIMTFGSRDKNVSLGMGYGYTAGDWAKRPMVTFSSMIRTGPRGYFLTENYYMNAGGEQTVIISLGGRSMLKRVGIDYGLFMPISEGLGFVAIPWLGLTAPLGKR